MRVEGSSLIEVIVSIMLWSAFIFLFQAYDIRQTTKDALYLKQLEHYHIIEHAYMMQSLLLFKVDAYVLNQYGKADPLGSYEVFVFDLNFQIYYEGELIHDSALS